MMLPHDIIVDELGILEGHLKADLKSFQTMEAVDGHRSISWAVHDKHPGYTLMLTLEIKEEVA